jgi:hypothetical protein
MSGRILPFGTEEGNGEDIFDANGEPVTGPETVTRQLPGGKKRGRPAGGKTKKAGGERPVPAPTTPDPVDGEELLADAVANPGSCELPPPLPDSDAPTSVDEIPDRDFDDMPGAGSEVPDDPATMSVEMRRSPGTNTWFRIHPRRIWRGLLFAYKEEANRSAELFFVTPALEKTPGIREQLVPATAVLCEDLNGVGEAFIWLVPANEMSPYFKAMQKVLAKDATDPGKLKFLVYLPRGERKNCKVKVDYVDANDPHVTLPERSITKLLPEAIGQDHLILHKLHPVFVRQTRGRNI